MYAPWSIVKHWLFSETDQLQLFPGRNRVTKVWVIWPSCEQILVVFWETWLLVTCEARHLALTSKSFYLCIIISIWWSLCFVCILCSNHLQMTCLMTICWEINSPLGVPVIHDVISLIRLIAWETTDVWCKIENVVFHRGRLMFYFQLQNHASIQFIL